MGITAEEVLAEIGPVQEVLDAHDGVVTVHDTSGGVIMLSLDGGCNGCSSTPMTAMQIFLFSEETRLRQRCHIHQRGTSRIHAYIH